MMINPAVLLYFGRNRLSLVSRSVRVGRTREITTSWQFFNLPGQLTVVSLLVELLSNRAYSSMNK